MRPIVKIPVRTTFCAWPVLRRQRMGIGYTDYHALVSHLQALHPAYLSLTKARRVKSVAALIAPAIRK